MKGLELRQATEEDDNFLYHLKKLTPKHYVECMWGEWNKVWQRDHFRKNFDPSHINIVILDGYPVYHFRSSLNAKLVGGVGEAQ